MHNQSNTPAISPLRRRLIDDMNLRHFGHETQRNYLRDVGRLASFLGRSPDTATADDLRRFQIWQQSEGVPVPTMNSIVSALRFFFNTTVDRPDLARRLVRLAQPRKLPVVLSREEVTRLLDATICLKHQAALAVAYGSGLRVRSLPDQEITGAQYDCCSLRLFAFYSDKAHRWSLGCLADRLGISHVVLLALHKRLDVGRWDHPDFVPQTAYLTRPEVGASTGFHRNQAPWQATKELQNLPTPQLLAKHNGACLISSVDLKHVFSQIQPDRTNFAHDAHPNGGFNNHTLPHTRVVAGVYIINSNADHFVEKLDPVLSRMGDTSPGQNPACVRPARSWP